MGSISPAGVGVDALWTAARDGRSGVAALVLPRDAVSRVKIAAQVHGFDPASHLPPETIALTERFSQFALVAADEALRQAGLSPGAPLGPRTAIVLGTGIGGAITLDDSHHTFYVTGGRGDPMTIPRVMANAGASYIAMRHGVTGPCLVISTACASATQAIGLGMTLVRGGAVDRAIVGGSEAMITPSVFRAWELMRVLAPVACRPFSKHRNGMVLGEGAAVLILEAAEIAAARGQAALAEIAGYGTSTDAGDLLRPDPEGAAAAMRQALADADLAPDAIDYVNAHGTGTFANDSSETRALHQVFGARIAVSSTKPIHGHALGATGALELVITIMAVRSEIAPPTINWLEADPGCAIDAIPNVARPMPIRAALSNSFAFGGINAVVAVRAA